MFSSGVQIEYSGDGSETLGNKYFISNAEGHDSGKEGRSRDNKRMSGSIQAR